jgi:hypothetical protein
MGELQGVLNLETNLLEVLRRRVILVSEGWAFTKDKIGLVIYHRAVSPDGWVSLIDVRGKEEDWAINKAWDKRNETAKAQFQVAEWLRKHGDCAGLTWDKPSEKFCASVFVRNGYPQEAYGESPAAAVANWLVRWGKSGA